MRTCGVNVTRAAHYVVMSSRGPVLQSRRRSRVRRAHTPSRWRGCCWYVHTQLRGARSSFPTSVQFQVGIVRRSVHCNVPRAEHSRLASHTADTDLITAPRKPIPVAVSGLPYCNTATHADDLEVQGPPAPTVSTTHSIDVHLSHTQMFSNVDTADTLSLQPFHSTVEQCVTSLRLRSLRNRGVLRTKKNDGTPARTPLPPIHAHKP